MRAWSARTSQLLFEQPAHRRGVALREGGDFARSRSSSPASRLRTSLGEIAVGGVDGLHQLPPGHGGLAAQRPQRAGQPIRGAQDRLQLCVRRVSVPRARTARGAGRSRAAM